MAELVVEGAMISCTFALGALPAPLFPTSAPDVSTTGGVPAATIMDFAPMKNIPTFGMCTSPANPDVASATAAALGVLTPMPCIPNTVAPWTPGSPLVTFDGNPALMDDNMCTCLWGGQISIISAGQSEVSGTG